MLKVLKNLKESWLSVIAIVLLLIVQAAGDLTLPDYTSKIVNIGIQSGGIENPAPEVIRKSEMDNLLIFTEDDEQILNDYKEISKENLDEKEYEKLVKKYPALENETLYEVKKLNSEEQTQLNNMMTKPLMMLGSLENEETANSMKEQMLSSMSANIPEQQKITMQNMELIDIIPEFNLYEDFWKIYTKSDYQPPQYTGDNASIKTSIVSEGAQIYGSIEHCVISKNVTIEEGAVVKDSIIMEGCVIGKNAVLDRVIVDQNTVIGDNVKMGLWDNIPNEQKPKIYNTGITVIGSDTVVPDNIEIGKNCVVYGKTTAEDYSESKLPSGQSVIIEGAM